MSGGMASALIPLAQGCEELEAVTLIDLLRRAQIEVVTAGLTAEAVTGRCGTVLVPDMTLEKAMQREFDLIVLPGGAAGADRLENDARVVELLRKMAMHGKYIAAICAAPKVLAAAGLLDGKRATCYPGSLDVKKYPRIRLENRAIVIDGKILTSRGPGTAMDFALELIYTLSGRQTRDKVEAELARPPEQALAQLADWG